MLCKFDHLSLVIADLQKTTAAYSQLGFHVTDRLDAGESETENRLVCFTDGSYLEIMAFKDPSRPSTNRWWSLAAKGDGWADYSLHTDDMNLEIRRLTQLSVPMIGPRSAGKTRQDGLTWSVRTLLLGRGVASPVLPYLIEDTTQRDARVPSPGATQPGGIAGISAITLLTTSLVSVDKSLTALFGLGVPASKPRQGASEARVFGFAGRAVEVLEVQDAESELGRHMNLRGEGVFEVTLGKIPYDPTQEFKTLPIELTHGARLRMQLSNRS